MPTETLVVCASHSPMIESVDGGAPGAAFLGAIRDARTQIAQFAADLIVFFGPDHSRALQNLVPAVTVVGSAIGYGDWGTPADPYSVRGDLAGELATNLLGRNFDVAYGEDIRLDHGFGQTFVQLFDTLGAVPCLPVVLNCARPPLPLIPRIIDLGKAVGEFFDSTGLRVLYVGSGGLSHQPPSMRRENLTLSEPDREAIARRTVADAAKYINPEWDNGFLKNLTNNDWDWLSRLTIESLNAVGTGTNEIRTWLAAWAAASATDASFVYAPVPEWITGMGVVVGHSQ